MRGSRRALIAVARLRRQPSPASGRREDRGGRGRGRGNDNAGRSGLLLDLLRRAGGVGARRHQRAQPRPFGAVPHPRLRQRRRPVPADGGRVPRHDPGRRLRRRGGGAVPVRRHAARRRFRRAQAGLRALSADRRADRAVRRRRARLCRARLERVARAGGGRRAGRRAVEHRGARPGALHPLLLLLPGGGDDPAHRDGRRDRADAAPQAGVKRQNIAAQVARNPASAVELRKVASRAGL